MERVRTMTISNWHALAENSLMDDDDNDRFFESLDRISAFSAADLDAAAASPPSSSSSSADDNFDDCRVSFASAVSSVGRSSNKFHSFSTDLYDVWMTAPGSITERRNRLLQGMGLANERRLPVSGGNPNQEQPPPLPRQQSTPVATVPRSRSEGDIESFSVEELRRVEILGSSKQRLTRTRSVTTSVAGNPGAALKEWPSASSSSSSEGRLMSAASRYGAFFLIKNLDTGKEFVVNEYSDDGAWNRLSDLETGKQLTLEEFEKCVGFSPVVKELMRRENVHRGVGGATTTASGEIRKGGGFAVNSLIYKSLRTSKRRGVALIKSGIKSVSGLIHDYKPPPPPLLLPPPPPLEQEVSNSPVTGWIKTRQSGKSHKDLSALHLCQEIQAHEGSIWAIKFSSDARFLASAGEDRVVQVWEVQECEVMEANGGGGVTATPLHPAICAAVAEGQQSKRGNRGSSRRSTSNSIPEYVHMSETVFALSEKPICSFEGHLDDVLDLSWSSSQLLLSSSMDKTVRLWDLESKACLKLFAHNDYVTCIQFNPVKDDYFISGSLDAKVRIWSIPDRQVVDWTDFHEMVTAACYTPDGQGAFIGSHKGHIRIYSAQDCKLIQTTQLDLLSKKKSHAKKITGFQFSPTNSTEVLVTSADSRVRILDGQHIVHKFKGLRNTSSQIAASFSQDGKYVISASEDSQVYVWKRDDHNHQRHASASKRSQVNTKSFEQFQCRDVSVAIPWPGTVRGEPPHHSKRHSKRGGYSSACASPTTKSHHLPPLPKKPPSDDAPEEDHPESSSSPTGDSFNSVRYADSPSTWTTAWGMVLVTATLSGEIRAYQNFGIPRKVGRQTSLFGGPT